MNIIRTATKINPISSFLFFLILLSLLMGYMNTISERESEHFYFSPEEDWSMDISLFIPNHTKYKLELQTNVSIDISIFLIPYIYNSSSENLNISQRKIIHEETTLEHDISKVEFTSWEKHEMVNEAGLLEFHFYFNFSKYNTNHSSLASYHFLYTYSLESSTSHIFRSFFPLFTVFIVIIILAYVFQIITVYLNNKKDKKLSNTHYSKLKQTLKHKNSSYWSTLSVFLQNLPSGFLIASVSLLLFFSVKTADLPQSLSINKFEIVESYSSYLYLAFIITNITLITSFFPIAFSEVGHVMTYPISRIKMWSVLMSLAFMSSLLLLVGWLGTCYYYRFFVLVKVSIEWKNAIFLLIIFLTISLMQISIIFISFMVFGSKENGIISAFIMLVIVERISIAITNLPVTISTINRIANTNSSFFFLLVFNLFLMLLLKIKNYHAFKLFEVKK
ncbi:MAG: hypothetical protein KAR35_02685 [Candidatus Heimdallarchaeota archaeon]|nr:hypothetical protein [Candidatus Heimdallarchaeota archaeon]MCK5048261.1 hypothetical protein [Candidatus Heimdallarchaeota archaeon]